MAVFQGLLEAALRDAAAGAFEDEEEDEGSGVTTLVGLKLCHCKLCNRNICERWVSIPAPLAWSVPECSVLLHRMCISCVW